MKRDEIIARINQNLDNAGIQAEKIVVQADQYGGWNIAVISSGFEGRPKDDRKAKCLAGLDDLSTEWIELFTPQEAEWAGPLPGEIPIEELPLWPESLARGTQEIDEILFASDLDQDLPLPLVVSFYSLRGGVGRSTALAYTGRILAAEGRKVVCVDMDLEAPGLAALFGLEREVGQHQGVVELLVHLDRGEQPDFSRHLIPVEDGLDLYIIPAGRGDANYARQLRFIDPSSWYREQRNPLRELLQGLEERLPFRPDVIFFDARTGINPFNAPLLFDLADLAVVAFFPHPQTRAGTGALVRALLAAKTRRQLQGQRLTPDVRFLVSPVPSSKAPEVVQRYRHRAIEWISEWLAPANERPAGTPILEEEVTHFVAYRETLATADSILNDADIWREFEPIAQWISRFIPTKMEERAAVSLKDGKTTILGELRFGTGTAEQQDDFLETFVETGVVLKAIDPAVVLVLGRKGTGKTALFRRLAEGPKTSAVVVQAPASFRPKYPWLLGPDGFTQIDHLLASKNQNWSQFWAFLIAHALLQSSKDVTYRNFIPDALNTVLSDPVGSELEIVERFELTLDIARSNLLIVDMLRKINGQIEHPAFLLFDGLDTGFGGGENGRHLREHALNSLFSFLMDNEAVFDRLRFKILLREDIWRKLRFENKSHLFGRSVSLAWKDQIPFYKVVLKQALRSPGYKQLVEQSWSSLASGGLVLDRGILDALSDEQVFSAWNLLVGERMKGGKTAFTRNWVWNRLADANEDHSPRYLLQLFHTVTEWERRENEKSEYEKSLVRPRALTASLPTVSQQALEAIREEFSDELNLLLERLRNIGRTPFSAAELENLSEAVSLGREVGLLSVYEGTDESVQRYAVPEIYRHALGMTRKGQM